MADVQLQAVLSLKDEASSKLKGAGLSFGKLASAVAIGQAAYSAFNSAVNIGIGFLKSSIQASQAAQVTQTRLSQILQTVGKSSKEETEALFLQAEALESVGVVTKESIMQAQGQLASFDLQGKSIKTLIPSILNYIVAEKGIGAAAGEAQAVTNGLAQALQGNFAALTKTGFVLDDATKKLISSGTETERVEALTRVLNSTYSGLNEKMRETSAGGMFAMQVGMDNIKKTFGDALLEGLRPFISELGVWISDPNNKKFIQDVASNVGELAKNLGNLAIVVIPKAIKFLSDLAGGWRELNKTVDDTLKGLEAIQRFLSIDTKNNFANPFSRVGDFIGGLIPGKASGGYVQSGSPYMVGERGPELFTPGQSGNITPNNKLGGGGVTLNISGNTFGNRNDIDYMIQEVKRVLNREQVLAQLRV